MSLARAFESFFAERPERPVQICLTGGGPMHGIVTVLDGAADDPGDRVYKIVCEAQMGPSGPPMRMPFIFAGSSLVWYSTGPEADAGPRIATPGSTRWDM